MKNLEFVEQADGTEVLKSKESKRKNRRWEFEADVEITLPAKNDKPAIVLPKRTVKLEAVSYCTVKEVREDIIRHELYLRTSVPLFKDAKIRVRALPKETISNTTLRQLEGYRDMSAILDKALDMAIEEAGEVVLGKVVGSQFVEKPATEANGDVPAKPATTRRDLKEDFYKRALANLTPKKPEPEAVPEPEEEKKPFCPEIVEVVRAEKPTFVQENQHAEVGGPQLITGEL